ncbi:MAG TPA: CHASE3 domain-containing protein [Caulobacteraceae bacterium]|nr:CHASE3 domain-containing protein [Caulobacteraceae bacterium]
MGFKRVIAASVLLAVLVAGLSFFLVFTHLTSLASARQWVAHSHLVKEATQDLYASMQAAESGERGYVITRDPAYLDPYLRAVGAMGPEEARLGELVVDNAGQVARAQALARSVNERMMLVGRIVAAGRAGDFAGARAQVASGRGRTGMHDIRSLVRRIRQVEDGLLAERTVQADQQESLTLDAGLALSLVALAGLIAGVWLLARANRRLEAAMHEARASNAAREATDALTRALFDNVTDYLFVINIEDDERYILADLNPAFARAMGVKAEQVRGRAIDALLPGQASQGLIAHYRRVRAAGTAVTTRDEIPGLPDGPRTWESILAPVKNPRGATDRIIGAVRDITERLRADERLRDSQRMEAIGQLTGGVAHDFNNLLQVIRGNLELLESAVAGDDRAAQRLKSAIHGADRAAQLTRQLLAFARRTPLAPQVVNLSRLVGEMADLLRRTLGEAIEVETVVGGGLWNTIADPAQVESALLNLALNARYAMPEGGRLTVEITNASLDESYARAASEVTAGQYVMLAVSDTGQGMDEATKARVFEPFFTTKPDGKGTGLGLSMVYGFVKQSNGHIQIYSEPGHGTTVKIYLPRSREATSRPPPPPDEAALGASRTVLVVEDEPEVRAATVAMLGDLGYRCLEAADAQSALAIIEAGAEVDLVFTDVVLPGPLRTRDFAQRLAEARPDLPVLFTSGYTDNAIVHHGRLDEGVNLISKPYARAELARRLAQLLAQRRAAGAVSSAQTR